MFSPETYWDAVDRAENMEKVRALCPGNRLLSWNMIRLLSMVMYEDYALFPSHD